VTPVSVRLTEAIPALGLLPGEVVAYYPDRPDLGVLVTRSLPVSALPDLALHLPVFRRVAQPSRMTPAPAPRHLRAV
jgi:hypothetical protein